MIRPCPEPNEFGLVDCGEGNYMHLNHIDHLRGSDGRYWVDAEAFMAVQKERDDFNRVLALINAEPEQATQLLASVGFGPEDAKAMRGLLRAIRAGTL